MSNYFPFGQLVEHGTHGEGCIVGAVTTSDEPKTTEELWGFSVTKPKKAVIYRVKFDAGIRLCDPRRLRHVYI